MSIQIGTTYSQDSRNKLFNNERIRLFSDVHSNLLEIASSCNITSIKIDRIVIGSSNYSSNNSNFNSLIIDSYSLYEDTPYRLIEASPNSFVINSSNVNVVGNLNVANNTTINGSSINNNLISNTIVSSNIALYATHTDRMPFVVSSNSINQLSYEAKSNIFVIQPNVGIGTTLTNYRLQVEGDTYVSDRLYTSFISSNIDSSNILVYGNLDVRGRINSTDIFDFENTFLDIVGLSITNTKYVTNTGMEINQLEGYQPLMVVNKINLDSSTTVVSGISSTGRTYIGTDVTNVDKMGSLEHLNRPPAMFTVSLPSEYSSDHLVRATSYNACNEWILSRDAYCGIGTNVINHPIHLHMQSNTNMLRNSLSNNPTIGMYHINMPNKPFLAAYSNSIQVVSIDGAGNLAIGSNNETVINTNGDIIASGTVYSSNVVIFNSLSVVSPLNLNLDIIGANNILGSNVYAGSILASNVTASNISGMFLFANSVLSSNMVIANNALLSNVYISGTLSGPNITEFSGVSTGSQFIPLASGPSSITHLKSSNVLMSITNDLVSASTSNGVLQIRTYGIPSSPISAGVSVYGHDRSSILITADRPYYQLQRPNGTVYNIGINGVNEFQIGLSNSALSTDYTLPMFKVASNILTLGNSKTFLYSTANGSVLVAPTYDPVILDSGGFEVKGIAYFRTLGNLPIVFMNSVGNVGIGKTTPSKTLDILGEMIVSQNIGIGTTIPRATLDVEGSISAITITAQNINRGGYGVFYNTTSSYPTGVSTMQFAAGTSAIPSRISVSSGIFTVIDAGTYYITVQLNIDMTTGNSVYITFALNISSTNVQISSNYRSGGFTTNDDATAEFMVTLPANGTFRINIDNGTGSSLTCNTTEQYSRVTVSKVG